MYAVDVVKVQKADEIDGGDSFTVARRSPPQSRVY